MDEVTQGAKNQDDVNSQIDQAISSLPGGSDNPNQQDDQQSDSAADANNQTDQSGQVSTQVPSQVDEQSQEPAAANTTTGAGNDNDLQKIKDEALDKLRPLVDKLDQQPDEKFDTLLMLIRASDDKSLIKPAYEAAEGIADDQKRAKALLDIVNEVNYLTQTQPEEK